MFLDQNKKKRWGGARGGGRRTDDLDRWSVKWTAGMALWLVGGGIKRHGEGESTWQHGWRRCRLEAGVFRLWVSLKVWLVNDEKISQPSYLHVRGNCFFVYFDNVEILFRTVVTPFTRLNHTSIPPIS